MTQVQSIETPTLDSATSALMSAQWASNGYARIEGGIPPSLCEALAQEKLCEFDRQAAAGSDFRVGGMLSGHLNCFPGEGSKALADAVEQTCLTQFMSKMLGKPVMLTSVGCNANLPGSHYQNFNTDSDWWNEFVVVNVGLVDTDRVNGSTELVVGRDKTPLRYWQFVAKGRARKSVRHPMNPGDTVIRPSTLWHRGTPNRSQRMRPMLGLVYSPVSADANPVDFQPGGGRIAFAANRFGSDPKGRLAEVFCVYFPWVRAMLRFCKSFVARSGQST